MNLLEKMKSSASTQRHFDFINIYEKVLFMEAFFDKDSILNIENRTLDNKFSMKSITGMKKGQYKSLMANELCQYITLQYPESFDLNLVSMQMGLNNNEIGWDSFVLRIFTDNETVADYTRNLMLNKLPNKEYKKIKLKKI